MGYISDKDPTVVAPLHIDGEEKLVLLHVALNMKTQISRLGPHSSLIGGVLSIGLILSTPF